MMMPSPSLDDVANISGFISNFISVTTKLDRIVDSYALALDSRC